MPTSAKDIYKEFLFKVNKNDTNTNIKVPEQIFVILFNEQKRKLLNEQIKVKESNDYIEDFSDILTFPIDPLEKISEDSQKATFKLPSDFLLRVSAYCLASRGNCKNNILTIWFVKPKNINVLLQNTNENPSFDYQETIGLINSNNLTVYKTDFNIDETYLTYYREPQDLDISGYTKNGIPSIDQVPDMDLINIEKIIDRTVTEVTLNYENIEKYQLMLQRQQLGEK